MNQEGNHPVGDRFADVNLAEQTEEQLIERGLNGDARALDALFARNTRALYQTALRVLGNPEDAEEALRRIAFRLSQSSEVREEIAIFHLADANRHQRGLDASPQQTRPACRVAG
jgi:hypothetical protein